MGIGEILDAGIKLYLRHWQVLVLCVIGFVVPLAILDVIVQSSVDPDQLRIGADFTTGEASDVSRGGQGLLRLITIITFLVSQAACFKAVSDAWLGGEPAVGRSVAQGLRRLLPMLGFILLAWLAAVVALILIVLLASALGLIAVLLIIPAIVGLVWIYPLALLAVVVIVLEETGPIRGWRRANDLIRERWWGTFGTLLLGLLLTVIIVFIIGFILGGAIAL